MNEVQFNPTASNMVQTVINIIDGYGMGPMRALAQEPVQNAKDAAAGKGPVQVEYRLIRRQQARDNRPCYLLTVTDQGTTGLRGPIVSAEELERRDFKLKPEENWAAFEGQGYTKENEDALGSRGQGKAAFLYHSRVPPSNNETAPRRMMMLYDTLLADGEYRLGLRFARPVDQVRTPLLNYAARAAIRETQHEAFADHFVPLGLEPLQQTGTRVIVPYFDPEAVPALRWGGELGKWLQRCWWRAIQRGELTIRIVDEERSTEELIAVPRWWRNIPREPGGSSREGRFYTLDDGSSYQIWGDLPLKDGGAIRRLTLMYDEHLEEEEIISDHPEFAGIQLLRGQQWIETRGAREEYGDSIPPDKRAGFRGFAEFIGDTDARLRECENSQHDGFNGRKALIREIRGTLEKKVGEFSRRMGWESEERESPKASSAHEKRVSAEFQRFFTQPRPRNNPKHQENGRSLNGSQLLWHCHLDLAFPDPTRARVDWGQEIRNLHLQVAVEPGEEMVERADLLLEWVNDQGENQEIWRHQEGIWGSGEHGPLDWQLPLGDWQLICGKARQDRQIECPKPGIYTLRAAVEYQGTRVATASRTIYVKMEPPTLPSQQPITLSISAVNADDDRKKRIDHGEVLHLQINARNRSAESKTYYLTASLPGELLANDAPVELPATAAGDAPRRKLALDAKRRLLDPEKSRPMVGNAVKDLVIMTDSGEKNLYIRAELKDAKGEYVVNPISKLIYFQRDPGRNRDQLPFELAKVESEPHSPMWRLNDQLDELHYPDKYPLYIELPDPQRRNRRLQGRDAFTTEISANGLLEWALRPKENGDESNLAQLFAQLKDNIQEADDSGLWEKYRRRLEKLGNMLHDSPIDFAREWRETVAIMLRIFREGVG